MDETAETQIDAYCAEADMHPTALDAYVEAQVLTATPQKLRLLLVEGAIRFARQTLRCWEQEKEQEALDALMRCRAIVSELLSSIRVDQSPLTRRVAAIYVFLFQTLMEAQLQHDRPRVERAIEVLEVERETWRQVCETMPHAPSSGAVTDRPEITSTEACSCLSQTPPAGETPHGGLALDA